MENKSIINDVKNRFLPLTEAVAKGLEDEPQLADFEIIKELGSGSFGRVYLVIHRETNAQYAIKAIDKRNKANIDGKPYFRREIEIMYKISHPNVVKLFSHFEDEINCYFLMEYISKGNLYGLISSQKTKALDAQKVAILMRDVISAVYYLQNMDPPIIHRDIKPENALLNEKGVVKLTDFGWSNYIQGDEERMTFCGTPIYLAPEMIKGGGHDEHVDIWCIGVLIFELLTGKPPFIGNNKEQLLENIIKLKINWPKDINTDAKGLISKILKIDPKSRITLQEMLQHPFFTKYVTNSSQYLIKPSIFPKDPFVVSKDDPEKAIEFQIQPQTPPKPESQTQPDIQPVSQPQSELQQIQIKLQDNQNTKEKKTNRQRDISPVPMSKLNLERLDKITKLNVIKMGKKSNNKDSPNKSSSNHDTTKIKKEYESLMSQYFEIQKLYNEQTKKVEEAETKVTFLLKEKNKHLKEIEEKEDKILEFQRKIADLTQKLNDKDMYFSQINKSTSKNNDVIKSNSIKDFEYQKMIDEKDREIGILREKVANYKSNNPQFNSNKDSNNSAQTRDNSSNLSNKNNDALITEIEKLQTEKEKLEGIIMAKTQEIQKYKDEQKDIKETEGKKYKKIIDRYEHILTLHENENKKLKTKVRDLETKLAKFNLTK